MMGRPAKYNKAQMLWIISQLNDCVDEQEIQWFAIHSLKVSVRTSFDIIKRAKEINKQMIKGKSFEEATSKLHLAIPLE